MLFNKQWEDHVSLRSLPFLFPIIEPRCPAVEGARWGLTEDSCLLVEWESGATVVYDTTAGLAPWQVEYRPAGASAWISVDCDSSRLALCGLPVGDYEVRVRSRCDRIGGAHWTAWRMATAGDNGGSEGIAATGTPAATLAPNPARGTATLVLKAPAPQAGTLQVSDMAGRQVMAAPVAQGAERVTLDVSTLPHGIYTVTLRLPEGATSLRLAVE